MGLGIGLASGFGQHLEMTKEKTAMALPDRFLVSVMRGSVLMALAGPAQTAVACQACHYEVCLIKCACVPNSSCVLPDPNNVIDIVKKAADAPRLVATTFVKAVADIGATVHKAFDDTNNTLGKAVEDVKDNVGKAGNDLNAEAGRFGRGLGNTVDALIHAAESTTEGLAKEAERAADRVRQGKVIDALWGAAIGPIQVAEQSASEAVLESDYLRGVGQVAATAYGGPAGAASYAAWLTYKQTGDPSLALRVGILTGATVAANAGAGQITDLARRTVVTAAIGGAAVAAAGGNAEAVQRAFLQAGAMVVVQDGFQQVTKGALDGRASKGDAYCISAESTGCTPLPEGAVLGTDKDGNFIVNMEKVDRRIPAVGLKDHTAFFNESNPAMTAVSRIPGMQAMAVFHDNWAIKWDMGALTMPATILPAIVLTYVGTGAPYFDTLQTTAVERALAGKATGENPNSIVRSAREGLAVNPFNVVNTGILFNEAGSEVNALVHERREGALWCSDGYLLKPKPLRGGLGEFVHSRCLKSKPNYAKGEPFTVTYPDLNVDFACRVLKREAGKFKVVTSSLWKPHDCDETAKQLFERNASELGAFYVSKGVAVEPPKGMVLTGQ
jgi:hypothetical protein